MTTSIYALAPSAAFSSIYGQPGFYGQPGYEQLGLSPFGLQPQAGPTGFSQPSIGYGFPQLFGQQFGIPQQSAAQPQPGFPQQPGAQQLGFLQQLGFPQQFGMQPQFSTPQQSGGADQVSTIVQVVPQLLWAAQQNLAVALQLTQQLVLQVAQQYGRPGTGESPLARPYLRPYTMTW